MKILTLLLHDERFSSWTVRDKLSRQHFSLRYLRFCRQKGWEPLLYTFHQHMKNLQTWQIDEGTVKIFPVKFRLPPFLRFGNDHNPADIMREACEDQPDVVHFHHYYLYSFPYMAVFVKKRLKRPLTVQLHGYDNSAWRKWFYAPSLLALKNADLIFYSYKPEEDVYRKLGVVEKAVRVPVPGIDPEIFKRKKRSVSNRLLYVGRIPKPEGAYGEKSPFILLHLLRNLLPRLRDATLDVVGDGPGLPGCKRLASVLKLGDHVSFHGYVSHSELPRYYQSAALTFAPIRVCDVDGWFDGAIQESLACGTPVAAFKASVGTPLRGTRGFMLSGDVRKAAEEAAELLGAREDMNQVAADGSRFVHENCTCARLAAELQEAWEGVAGF